MTDTDTLKNILNFSEVTMANNFLAYIDKYNEKNSKFDWQFAIDLLNCELLQEDSGNFKTGELHFKLSNKNICFVCLKATLRSGFFCFKN